MQSLKMTIQVLNTWENMTAVNAKSRIQLHIQVKIGKQHSLWAFFLFLPQFSLVTQLYNIRIRKKKFQNARGRKLAPCQFSTDLSL